GSKVIYELRRRHFPDPWGRPAPGTVESVTALRPDDLRRFYQQNYRHNGAILGIAGAVDPDALHEAVGRLFGSWQGQPQPAIFERSNGPRRAHLSRQTKTIHSVLD